MKYIVHIILLVTWLMGIVLAKGFWLTLLSIIFPFYAYYLVVEHAMRTLGWI